MEKKQLLLLILALLMLPLAADAQARTGGQKTENYPTVVNGHLAFMGISLAETPATFKKRLQGKGFKVFQEYEGDVTLKGPVNGVSCLLYISKGNVDVREYESYTLSKAKVRFRQLVQQLEGIYGKGTRGEDNDEYNLSHEIKVAKGSIIISMHNEDEMDGSSDCYMVSAWYKDIRD